ncbi:uncharacterized protein with NRDE domain [Acinetobacter calcoaceticus]|uniref:Uncharacterized protein with NRDE domain n=1 Tax=Acinetobacter calcoaceticus TaxID=471 RepID=A0A4V2R224_ACICA|nr:uncharacterized protein with NRDE domain [Acinetobacter calcoaceticus]
MCIVAFAWQLLDQLPLCLISNRDEFYQRPTSALHSWAQSPIIAGQDLQSGGTWMGVTEQGRWAIVTNFREGQDQRAYPTSRGALIQQFLESDQTPIRFAQQLEKAQCDYAGFNLFVGDRQQAVYMSNRGEAPQVLAHGVYVVSNGLMSDDWAKTRHLRQRFTQELLPMLQHNSTQTAMQDLVWDILEDERKVLTEHLPETGVPAELEQLLSSTFIQSPRYGTRCSNFLQISKQHLSWAEKSQQGADQGQVKQIEL